MALVTLTTDFGVRDPWVGSMKGVILSICPEAGLVDLSHEVPRHSVPAAAYVLERCLKYFPPRTVHLVVVDPGVGSARRPLVGAIHGQFLVGPDNGLFGDLGNGDSGSECFELTAREFLLTSPSQSPTFQGRDVFAPAAAHLARGVPLSAFGARVCDPVRLDGPPAASGMGGEVVWIDRFGNLITNLRPVGATEHMVVEVLGQRVPIVKYYAQAPDHSPAALINSDQVVEIFVNRGDAAVMLGAAVGTPIALAKAANSH